MATNPIIPESPEEVKPPRLFHIQIDTELADLALELFSTTFGMTWHESFVAAREMLGDLMMYAYQWDEDAYEAALSDEVRP